MVRSVPYNTEALTLLDLQQWRTKTLDDIREQR